MIKCGEQQREARKTDHRRKSLPVSTLCRGFRKGFVNTVESQLAVRGREVTLESTPGGIRTCDLRVRNALLYPAELRGR